MQKVSRITMKWTKIDKSKTNRPDTVSKYGDYKPFLRDEAKKRCVYCAIHDNSLGGIDHFHVEHYKPKSIPRFKSLEKDFTNLFYVCPICNRFKSNDWPNDPQSDFTNISYIDPGTTDYNEVFTILDNGKVTGKYVASKYMVEKIYLNRPQLINERREVIARNHLSNSLDKIDSLKQIMRDKITEKNIQELVFKIYDLKDEILKLLQIEGEISRYEPEEIKR